MSTPAPAPPPGALSSPPTGPPPDPADITTTQAPPPAIQFRPAPPAEAAPEPRAPSIHPPAPPVVETDEDGNQYRPFELGGERYRAAVVIPADYESQLQRIQLRLPRSEDGTFRPTTVEHVDLMDEMANLLLTGAVWDEDVERIMARRRDKKRPLNSSQIAFAMRDLWESYLPDELGKEPSA